MSTTEMRTTGPEAEDSEEEEEDLGDGVASELSEQTGFPASLITKLWEMWRNRAPPHFTHVVHGGVLPRAGLTAIVRELGVTHALLLESVVRVVAEGAPEGGLDFAHFIRGYAQLQSRTLQQALPFVFRVFDLDGDGKLARAEFEEVLAAVITLGGANPAPVMKMVVTQFAEHSAAELSCEQFRYFVSLNTQSVFATCAFMPNVQHFSASAIITTGKRAAAPPKPPRPAGDAADGPPDDGETVFDDEAFVSALESLKSTAVERAGFAKDKGNAAYKKGKAWWQVAVEHYTKGLSERCEDADANALLLSNRAAVHLSLKNHRHTLNDSLSALKLQPRNAKAARRAALGAFTVGEIDVAQRHCALALELSEPSAADNPSADLLELRALSLKIEAAVEVAADTKQFERAVQLVEAAKDGAVARRGIVLAPFLDEAVQAQLVGPQSGARVWWDEDADELHWPVLLLYPQYQQTDFLQDVSEHSRVCDILGQVLPADGPRAPWDVRGEYSEEAVSAYLAPGRHVDKPLRVSATATLAEVMQMKGAVVAGVPMLLVLPKDSAYERAWRQQEELDAAFLSGFERS